VAVLVVRVIPRASKNAIESMDANGIVRIRVTAPPVDSAANEAVVRLLATALDLPRRDLRLESGATARLKRFAVDLEPRELKRRLETAIRATP
jgi:uncharacterized protein YggU (UPF0235/DUF167 family)